MDNDQQKLKNEQAEILKNMKSSYKKERLIPFVGAGFSKNIIGYPDWDGFVRRLSRKIDKNQNFLKNLLGSNNLQSVEYFMIRTLIKNERMNDKDWYDTGKNYVKAELNDLFKRKKFNKDTWQAQVALISLKNFSLIYTTNWDDTLEKTCKEILSGTRYILYYTIAQLENLKEKYDENIRANKDARMKLIIKLHGDYSDAKTIIALEYDYYHRMNTFNALDTVFQNDSLLNDFLFLGFSFNDVNINYLLYQINYMRESVKPTNKVYLLSILKPDYSYYQLFKDHKHINVFYLFEDLNEYNVFSSIRNKREKTIKLRDKTVEFLNKISNNELKPLAN